MYFLHRDPSPQPPSSPPRFDDEEDPIGELMDNYELQASRWCQKWRGHDTWSEKITDRITEGRCTESFWDTVKAHLVEGRQLVADLGKLLDGHAGTSSNISEIALRMHHTVLPVHSGVVILEHYEPYCVAASRELARQEQARAHSRGSGHPRYR